jgi:hypothetical protein
VGHRTSIRGMKNEYKISVVKLEWKRSFDYLRDLIVDGMIILGKGREDEAGFI